MRARKGRLLARSLRLTFCMDSKQDAKLKMYLATKKVCDDNRTTWATLAGFKNAYDIFVQHVTAIGSLSEVQRSARAGVTLGKQELTHLLVDEALLVAGALCAYGRAKGDSQLCAFSDVTRDDFIRLADADIDDKALGIHDRAKAILDAQTATPPAAGAPKVADFGVKADELTARIPQPGQKICEHVAWRVVIGCGEHRVNERTRTGGPAVPLERVLEAQTR